MSLVTLYTPTLQDIEQARYNISKYLLKTPLRYSPPLSKLTSAEVYIKYENHNPTCAFKVRGGINLVSQLALDPKWKGKTLITGSSGNLGQSIAYAGKLFGFKVIIVVPEVSNPVKIQAIKDFGAEVVFYGVDTYEVWKYCEEVSKKEGYRYVHPVSEPDLICGTGTIGLEVYEDLPEVDCYITAIGAGSGICGASIALKSKNQKIKIYGVQAEGASGVYESFKSGKLVMKEGINTFAEGLATRGTFEYPFKIIQKNVEDIFLVSDEELKKSILLLLEHCHTVAEGAGAASLATLIKNKEMFKDKKVVCVLTGGNLQMNVLREIVKDHSS